MKRYEKFVFEAEKGITFEVSEGTRGELIIKALNIATANANSANYANPPIPEGYKHICGEWNNGFVIERCSDGSQFVWIPVGSLDSNGTLDGEDFSEKFGRRNYFGDEFEEDEYNEPITTELFEQIESVKKYGGFYISRYSISESPAGKPQSVKGAMPWVNINFYDAKKIASTIEDNEVVKSHLTFGAEYDSVWEWFMQTEAETLARIEADADEWDYNTIMEGIETGSREKWCVNNIYDFADTMEGWTQERYGSVSAHSRIVRGTLSRNNETGYPAVLRTEHDANDEYKYITFHATLYIK